jgi:hypothetical protein
MIKIQCINEKSGGLINRIVYLKVFFFFYYYYCKNAFLLAVRGHRVYKLVKTTWLNGKENDKSVVTFHRSEI